MSIYPSDVIGIHAVTKTFKKAKDIVEFAIVNGGGEIQFHEWFSPPRRGRGGKRKNDNRPFKLGATSPSLADYSDTLAHIFKGAKIVAAYPDNFHLAALYEAGFNANPYCKRIVNVARIYADNFIEPDITDKYWEDDDGKLHRRKLGVHPSYVTMIDAVLDFSSILSALGPGSARDGLWGAAASAFLFVEMSYLGTRGTTRQPIARPTNYELTDATDRYKSVQTSLSIKKQVASDIDVVLEEVQKLRLDYIDKRQNNGCLWIIGGIEISKEIAKLEEKGFSFNYKNEGGKATKGLPAWWLK